MQEVISVDITKHKILQGLIITIHLLALAAVYSSGLHLIVKLILTIPLLAIWIVTQRKYIKQRGEYQILSYFDDLPTAKTSPEVAKMIGWRVRSSADEWINLELQSSSVLLNFFMILTFVIQRRDDEQSERQQIIQLPLINGDILSEEFRALKVLLKFSD